MGQFKELATDLRVIFETSCKTYRIVELPDCFADMDNLKGDSFNPEVNSEIDPAELAKQEKDFEDFVRTHDVFGYALERWNQSPGIGYEHLDSCFGFIGSYSESEEVFKHYIVDEMKETIERRQSETI